MKIAFRCDASPSIGGGHVMRCLTLAKELVRRGAHVLFLCSPQTSITVPALAQSGLRTIVVSPLAEESVKAIEEHWEKADWLIVDCYDVGLSQEKVFRKCAHKILVIDDLADRKHDCDALLDANLGRKEDDYLSLVPGGAALFIGVQYALLRPEFVAARPLSLARRATQSSIQRILVSMGLTDIAGVTLSVVQGLLKARLDIDIDVVVGSTAVSLPKLQALSAQIQQLHLHIDANNMAELMVTADLCIGAAGSTSWERCYLGLPTIMIVLADNQIAVARELANKGVGMVAGNIEDGPSMAAKIVQDLIYHSNRIKAMAEQSCLLKLGNGVGVIASYLFNEYTSSNR